MDGATDIGAVVDEYVRSVLRDSSGRPIRRASPSGAFPDAGIAGTLQPECLLVVPDCNVLLKDIIDACRRNGRQTLVNAANVGAVRLFCAQHVVEEVFRHAREFADRGKVDPDKFLYHWREEYLPQMRIVPAETLPDHVLTPSELFRVRHLLASKDVPSVKLAIALGAFYLTEDKPAFQAVYDRRAEDDELFHWLEPLRDTGTADSLATLGALATLVSFGVLSPLGDAVRALQTRAPWAFIPIAGMAAYVGMRTSSELYRAILKGLGLGAAAVALIVQRYTSALDRFKAKAPPVRQWEELTTEIPRRSLLFRACLSTLARSPESCLSARVLAELLPPLGVGKSAQLVRSVLRENACFHEGYRSRWQVGLPIELVPNLGISTVAIPIEPNMLPLPGNSS